MVVPISPGRALKMTREDVENVAAYLGCDVAALKAVLAVESSGNGFDAKGRPTILFEPHVFFRNLDGEDLQTAIGMGLAYRRWGQQPYPRGNDAQYVRLEAARKINNEAAFRSVSVGLGQILGENFRAAGHKSAGEMFVTAGDSEGAQLMQMANFIKYNLLDDELRRKDWAAFARGYNGPAYAKNKYDVKLAAAYRKALA
jgi:hypothetical protein